MKRRRHLADADRLSPALLAAYVDGEVTPSETVAVERALGASPEQRRRAETLRQIRGVLTAPLPAELAAIDLAARVREADRSRRPATRRRLPRLRWAALGLGAAASCGLAAVLVGGIGRDREARRPDEFVSRSAGPSRTSSGGAGEAERWAGMRVFHQVYHQPGEAIPGAAGAPAPGRLAEALPAGDGLLFSYSNLGPRPFGYLMIVGRDAGGEARWYFPAYDSAGTNPSSVAIREGGANVALGELVHQPLPPGRLTLLGLFTRRPLRVLEVEDWLRTWAPGQAPPWPDTHLQIVTTTVVPGPRPGSRP